ncbi:MAG: tetratricopeptide repeat protein [Sumerlaeia bacterium]
MTRSQWNADSADDGLWYGEPEEELEDDGGDGDSEGFVALDEEADEDAGEFSLLDDEEEAAEDEEDDLTTLIEEGESLIESSDYAEAMEHFQDLAERYSDEPVILYNLGQAALMLFTEGMDDNEGHGSWEDDADLVALYEEAMNAFDAALAIDEEHVPSLNGQGALFMVADNVDAAIECWERSLELDPEQEDIAEALEEAKE